MSISQNHHDLFHGSNAVSDKLNLFQSLLDSKDLTSDTALALLNVIRAELERPQESGSSMYRRYAQIMGSLHEQMPDVYEQTVNAWQQKRWDKPSAERPISMFAREPVIGQVEPTQTSESNAGFEEPRSPDAEPFPGGQKTTTPAGSSEPLEVEFGEKEEAHAEPGEEPEEKDLKEGNEKEGEKDEDLEEEIEKEAEEEENEEKEENEEENREEAEKPEEEVEEKESESQEDSEPGGEEESQQEPEEEAEVEEAEPEEAQELAEEASQEAEVETGEASESREPEAEAETEDESDRMATEAAEAAAEAGHVEVETEETELPEMEEEEPPVEGGE